jgi:predicted amidohydrolase
MDVAVVQHRASSDKPDNLARLGSAIAGAAARGAGLIVCPEAAMHGFGRPDTPLAPVAEPLDGPFVTGLVTLAARHSVTVVAGMFETVADDSSRAYNTVVAVGPDGLAGRYRKLHLFDALGWSESTRLAVAPADDPQALLTVKLPDATVGVLTCYDLRFPEIARALADRGATVLAVPSAWVAGPVKEAQWVTLLRARAIENVCYVVAAAQPPPEYCGRSMVVDPDGICVAAVGLTEGVAVAAVDRDRVLATRERLPSLRHRRFAVTPLSGAFGEGESGTRH